MTDTLTDTAWRQHDGEYEPHVARNAAEGEDQEAYDALLDDLAALPRSRVVTVETVEG